MKKSFLALLLFVSTYTIADFRYIGEGFNIDSSEAWFYDTDYHKNDFFIKVWIQKEFDQKKINISNSKNYHSEKVWVYLDCFGGYYKILAFQRYEESNAKGKLIEAKIFDNPDTIKIKDGTRYSHLEYFMCVALPRKQLKNKSIK